MVNPRSDIFVGSGFFFRVGFFGITGGVTEMKKPSGYENADPAHDGFQYLEDLSTAYWYSQVLFTALKLNIFKYLDQGDGSIQTLANAASCKEDPLLRLLRALERMALVSYEKTIWQNSQVSSLFLIPDKSGYMGDFFLYRYYMQPNWSQLTQIVTNAEKKEEAELSYLQKNFLYVKAMDTLVRQKACEITGLVAPMTLNGPLLDVGGGAGSMIRAFQKVWQKTTGLVFDIPEVIAAARTLYPDAGDWKGITPVEGDFRTHDFEQWFPMIILSNFLHAYGPIEAKELLLKAVGLLKKNGVLLIHDYFPDRKGVSPQKGALYDLSMMLNTFNGVCHETQVILEWLKEAGVDAVSIKDLGTDSSLILAGGDSRLHVPKNPWIDLAYKQGFDKVVLISPQDIVTAPWVNAKCRYGCKRFGKNLQCPPHGMSYKETRSLLDSYTTAILVQGQPPGIKFHNKLLSLEKQAFLDGCHTAFALSAGPCPVCPDCPENGKCRHHHLARPSMEGSGIDVYTTVKNAGWALSPVKEKNQYVKYIGLLLVGEY